jgi:hypothetical protein
MPKPTHSTDTAVGRVVGRAAYEAAMARIRELTGATTQVQLAEVLDVRQSSISDAKRRASIPPEWVLKLHRLYRALPEWILEGTGPRTLDELLPEYQRELAAKVEAVRKELGGMADLIRDHLGYARMTADDLEARKLAAMHALEQFDGRVDLLIQALGKAERAAAQAQ